MGNTLNDELDRIISIEISRRDFWEYCKLQSPDFYKESRHHLKKLAKTLQGFYEGKLLKDNGEPFTKLMIRMPPQTGKTRTLVNFTKWVLGKNKDERIITGSYSDTAASDFSRYTRDGIQEIKNTPEQIVYSDIFPFTKIKYGNASYQKWALEGQHFNYLGVGVGGGVTGKGATLRIIDDLVKDIEIAISDTQLEKLWRWLSGTFSSRTSAEGGEIKEIFCATLWSENDPQSRLEQTEAGEWYILTMPMYDENSDQMLCDEIMNKQSYLKLKKRMEIDGKTKMVFYANYHCIAIDDGEDKVFPINSLKTYKHIPTEIITENDIEKEVLQGWAFAFADTADEGSDNFAMPVLQVIPPYVYLVDVIFDQENLTIQESQVESKVKEHKVREMVIETNNAGAYFKRRMDDKLKGVNIDGQWSKGNKMGRILSMAGIIKYYFRFPENPNSDTERFMRQVYRLLKTSTKEDDAPDSLAGAAAYLEKQYGMFVD